MERKHQDYRVGWICATTHELTAARAMLDEVHMSLPYDSRDSNSYTLGRIAHHNVVIASLPPGYYGSVPAAVAARDLLWSFPGIKFGLLVGIGSGVSSETHDIRLGDVVVSKSTSSLPAIVQFNAGKILSYGRLEGTQYLNKPPAILRSAVVKLRADHERHRPNFERYISETLKHSLVDYQDFSFPGQDQDLLFRTPYEHLGAATDCSYCDRSQLINRQPRRNQTTKVHYGLIGSSNSVVKHAATRDKLGREWGVLCLEMEAAGLMDNFPCLVIRGIADYADSHKNKKWQGYAALAAAAYAKELLSVIPGNANNDVAAAEVLHLGSIGAHREDLALDTADTVSDASTLIGSLEPGVVDSAIRKVVELLAAEENVRKLCSAAVLRITPSMLQWNLVAALSALSKTLKKLAQTPLEHGMEWLVRRYKAIIATNITENICRQDHIAMSLGLAQEETPASLDRRLMEILRKRFPAAQATSDKGRAGRENITINLEEVPSQDLEDNLDPDVQEPPESATLDDLSQLSQILCRGPAFEQMYEKLKMLLFPPIPQQIRNVLSKHLTTTTQSFTVACVIEWELLQYVEYENLKMNDIEYVFTLNGDFECACAISLGDYIRAMWRSNELLEAVTVSVAAAFHNNVFETAQTKSQNGDISGSQTRIQLVPALSNDDKEHAIVHISGSFDYISKTLEQLAWLAATLRLHREGQLTISYVDFRAQSVEVEQRTEVNLQLCLLSQDRVPQPRSQRPGQCWTSLFTESILAYGFGLPSRKRPDGMVGLELPFDVMAAFAGVQFPVHFGDRLVFANGTNVLIPQVMSGDSVLWHFDTIDNILRQATAVSKTLDPRLDNLDALNLRRSRAFLGYNKNSEIIIGTSDFDGVEIAASQVPRTGPAISLSYEGPLGLSVSAMGRVIVNAATTWRFNRGESAQVKSSELKLNDLINRSAGSPALLYDDQKCVAFLVPELSVILQMVATYLRQGSKLSPSKIPRARGSFDGGAAAYEAVKVAEGLMVPFGTGPPVKYIDIVKDFILIIEQRKTQKTMSRHFGEISFKKGFRGWDYTDVQQKRFEFWERELPTDVLKSRPIWWKLLKKSNAIALFCRDIKYPIRGCSDENSSSCISWDVIPEGRHLLLANVRVLEALRAEICHNKDKYPARFMLSDTLAWARPVRSRLFEENCTPGGFCNPIQTMRKVTAMTGRNTFWKQEPDFHDNPGQLEREGSVLFANEPRAFDKKECRFKQPGPNALQMKWNMIILSLCVAALSFMLGHLSILDEIKVMLQGMR